MDLLATGSLSRMVVLCNSEAFQSFENIPKLPSLSAVRLFPGSFLKWGLDTCPCLLKLISEFSIVDKSGGAACRAASQWKKFLF